jgi:hypothetical protein
MRYRLHLAALTVICVAAVGDAVPAQSQAYAPQAQLPEVVGNDPLLQMEIRSLQAAQVPDWREVLAPAYPGAVVVASEPPRAVRIGRGQLIDTYPVIILLTADAPEQVLDFYRQNLPAWNHGQFVASDYFWTGGDEFHPLSWSGRITASVQVAPARVSKLVPDARTEIHVRYRPGTGRL